MYIKTLLVEVFSNWHSIAEITRGNEFFMNLICSQFPLRLFWVSKNWLEKSRFAQCANRWAAAASTNPISILNIADGIQTSLSKITPSNCLCCEFLFRCSCMDRWESFKRQWTAALTMLTIDRATTHSNHLSLPLSYRCYTTSKIYTREWNSSVF